MNILKIPYFVPESLEGLENHLEIIKKEKTGIFYIQLGQDYDRNNG
jgi:hypothetical protein